MICLKCCGRAAINSVLPDRDHAAGTAPIIPFALTSPQYVSVKVYDLRGRLVNIVTDDNYRQGEHRLQLSYEGMSPGSYSLRFVSPEQNEIVRLAVMQ
jgi:hypothetical protein